MLSRDSIILIRQTKRKTDFSINSAWILEVLHQGAPVKVHSTKYFKNTNGAPNTGVKRCKTAPRIQILHLF